MIAGAVLFFVASFAAAAVTRSWTAVLMAASAWPLYFAGLLVGAWGSGVGEAWQISALLLGGACAAGAVLGLAVGRLLSGRPGP